MGKKRKQEIILSLPMRGEWIEIKTFNMGHEYVASLPMRGEWIEIFIV